MIRTIIVDDEVLAGVGIQSLIDGQEDISVSGVFGLPEEAIEFLKENVVDIVITDIEMADMNGLELIQMVRSENLANGIIILSCHDDFSYAQEAISKGTDSYLLKHNVSREMLVREIKKVYQKTSGFGMHRARQVSQGQRQKFLAEREIYMVGILRFDTSEYLPADHGQAVDRMMLTHLLEKIVSHYDMGTLFAPYNREMFIVFQFFKSMPKQDRQEVLYDNLSILNKNISQYINGRIISGISTESEDLKEMREKYDEAVSAADLYFYDSTKTIFVWHGADKKPGLKEFSREGLLEEHGMENLEKELKDYVRQAYFSQMEVWSLKGQLVQAVSRMVYSVLQEHRFSETLQSKWGKDNIRISAAVLEKNPTLLQEQLLETVAQFRRECLEDLNQDEFAEVLAYIDENLSDKLSLGELAEKSCMSIPSFSRKFKERVGKTLIQYLNERRIEKAKFLLENKILSLEQVAEEAGFSNANYLIRVFKKVTGQTIGEYRK